MHILTWYCARQKFVMAWLRSQALLVSAKFTSVTSKKMNYGNVFIEAGVIIPNVTHFRWYWSENCRKYVIWWYLNRINLISLKILIFGQVMGKIAFKIPIIPYFGMRFLAIFFSHFLSNLDFDAFLKNH